MSKNIKLQVYTPEKTVINTMVYRVVLPYTDVNLTVIEDRAPTSFLIEPGVMQILNEDDSVSETYFINGGIVDVAENVCKISTFKIIPAQNLNLEEAKKMMEDDLQDSDFYQMIIAHLQNFK